MGKGGRFRGRFDFDFLHFLAHFSSGSQFLSGRHIEQSIPDIRREKGEEDVSRVVSSPVHTDNWVVRESFIVQGARLFIPFHCIAFQASIESVGKTMGANMLPTFLLLIHIFLYIFCLFTFLFRIYAIYRGDLSSRTPLVGPSNQETPT